METFLEQTIYDPTIGKIIATIIGVIIIWLVLKVVQNRLFNNIEELHQRYRVKKASSFVGFLLTVVLISVIFSDKLGGFTVALGVAGAGIAFALQEVIASVAGWAAIMFGGFYKTGDRVQLGGIKGDVIDIGVLRTTLMETGQWVDGDLYNGRIVRIANSFVFKEPVFNYSSDFPFLWDEIKIPVRFGSNYDLAETFFKSSLDEIISKFSETAATTWKQLVKKYLIENATTKPMITMIFNDNWVEFTLRYPVEYKRRRITKDKLFRSILKQIESSDGEVKLASATFEIVDGSGIKVKVEK
ncbi:mechanosensitive ion channel domain-containing protein [Ekhidna sp.]|uniref:mechanosensitive ion channel family protein n=1 Tax=Ekhidna sp. TaxID=2608089 RepID=UPI003297F644